MRRESKSEQAGPTSTVLGVVLTAAATGAVAGLVDLLRDAWTGECVLTVHLWLRAEIIYVLVWTASGIVAGPILWMVWRRRAVAVAARLYVPFSAAFLIAGAANRHVLTGSIFSTGALVLYGIVLVLALLAVALLARRGFRGGGPRVRVGVLLVCLGIAAVAPVVSEAGAGSGSVEVAKDAGRRSPSILFLLVDTLRADHTSLYGYERRTTPNLEAFAERAVVFERARAESNWTKASVATIFTGLPPMVHGQLRTRHRLPGEAVTVAEALRAGGYRTACFSDNPHVTPVFGLVQGFEHTFWHHGWGTSAFRRGSVLGQVLHILKAPGFDRWICGEVAETTRGAKRLNAEFLEWLDGLPPDAPWFGYIQYMEPHEPYHAPGDWRLMYVDPSYDAPARRHRPLPRNLYRPWMRAEKLPAAEHDFIVSLYDGEIAYWDDCFRELLGELGKRVDLDDLVIVVTSDHGEEFYEHEGYGHGQSLYEELLHVPLVIRRPGDSPARVKAAVSLGSLFPTVLQAAGVRLVSPPRFPPPPALFPLPSRDRAHFAAARPAVGVVSWTMIREHDKWIWSRRGDEELLEQYDLAADPRERANLAEEREAEAAAAKRELERVAEIQEGAALRGGNAEMSSEMEEALRGLGYTR